MIDQTVENVPRLSEPSLSSLVGGIINDFQSLMKQEVALARRELADELRKAKQAAISLGIGVGILAIGGLLLIFMLVHLLSWAVPAIPLWACYGIIGGLLILAGPMADTGGGPYAAPRQKPKTFTSCRSGPLKL